MSGSSDCSRLWIGNLDLCLSEFQVLKMLQQYGTLTKFEYVYHTAGPLRGTPRGFCFASFERIEDADRAIRMLNGKFAGSRRLTVRTAHDVETLSIREKERRDAIMDTARQQELVKLGLTTDSAVQHTTTKSGRDVATVGPTGSGSHQSKLASSMNSARSEAQKESAARGQPANVIAAIEDKLRQLAHGNDPVSTPLITVIPAAKSATSRSQLNEYAGSMKKQQLKNRFEPYSNTQKPFNTFGRHTLKR